MAHGRSAEVHAALTLDFDHQAKLDTAVRAEAGQAERDRRDAPRLPLFRRLRA